MKTLKFLFVLGLFCSFSLHIQGQSATAKAFAVSYEFESSGRYVDAANGLKAAVSADNYEACLRLGWLYFKANKHSEAIGYYAKASALKPNSIEARLGWTMPLAAAEKWDEVLTQYVEILKLDPNHSTTNYQAGMIYYYRKDYKTCEKYFEKVVSMYPFDYSGNLMLGWTKYFLGKNVEAKALFDKVLCYMPNDASALEGLSFINK